MSAASRRDLLRGGAAMGVWAATGGAAAAPEQLTLGEADFAPVPGEVPAARSAVYDAERPFLFEGLEPRHAFRVVRSLFVPMRDGMRLSTDFYVPLGAKPPLPVVLSRTPYGKQRPSVEGRLLAEQGFIFAYQDVRGRFESEGEFVANTGQDREDGYDTVSWLARQPWCSGRVGAIGSSYLGETAAKLAATRHPNHACSILMFDGAYGQGGSYNGAFMQGGAAMLRALFEWARDAVPKISYGPPTWIDRQAWFRSAAVQAYASQPVNAPKVDAGEAVRALPVAGLVARSGGPSSEFEAMVRANAEPGGAYFKSQRFLTEADSFSTPTLHLSGNEEVGGSGPRCFSLFRRRAVNAAARDHQHLIFAASPHSGHRLASAHTVRGVRDFGDTRFPYFKIFVDWFDHWLRGGVTGVEAWPKAQWFVTGRNKWEAGDSYPPADVRPLYLHLQAGEGRRGGLSTAAPPPGDAMRYRYDPLDPTPSEPPATHTDMIGVAFADRAPLEARADLLVFTSPPLTRALDIAGPVTVALAVSSDSPDTDFVAVLHEVDARGRAIFVTHGITRMRWLEGFDRARPMTPGEVYRIELDLWFANLAFQPGSRVRLHVASAHFPFFDRNLNTGDDNGTTTAARVATNSVHLGPSSFLTLPARGGTEAAGLFAGST